MREIARRKTLLVFVLFAAILTAAAKDPVELTVYCGAGLTGALSEIGEIYESRSNVSVKFNFDGVPALRAQIEQGAYADILVSANLKHMNALMSKGFIDNSTVKVFARNKVAIIVPNGNPANITGLKDLAGARRKDLDGDQRPSSRRLCTHGPGQAGS